jgi:hypothetical protein
MAWLNPFEETSVGDPPGVTVMRTVRGLMAWTLATEAHCDVRVADAAIGAHITSSALVSAAGTAAILESAREDIAKMSPEDRWRAP